MTTWTQWLTTTLGGLASLATFGAGCLTTQGGCVQTAADLAGFQPTGVDIRHGWFSGTRVTINDRAQAKGDLEYDPATGKVVVHFEGNTDPASVIGAQGERADHLIRLREIEAERIVETHKAIGANIRSAIDGLAMAMAVGGDAGQKWIDAVGPILKGSAVSIDGLGDVRIGEPVVTPDPVDPGARKEIKHEAWMPNRSDLDDSVSVRLCSLAADDGHDSGACRREPRGVG